MKGIIEVSGETIEQPLMELDTGNLEIIVMGSFRVLDYPREHKLLIVNSVHTDLSLEHNDFASKVGNTSVHGRCVVLTGDDYKEYILNNLNTQ